MGRGRRKQSTPRNSQEKNFHESNKQCRIKLDRQLTTVQRNTMDQTRIPAVLWRVQSWWPYQPPERGQGLWKRAVRRRIKIHSRHLLRLQPYKLRRKNYQIKLTKKKWWNYIPQNKRSKGDEIKNKSIEIGVYWLWLLVDTEVDKYFKIMINEVVYPLLKAASCVLNSWIKHGKEHFLSFKKWSF